MTQVPNLKFDKNRKFLTEQLEIQKVKVDNITDIISNIKFISQSYTCNQYYLNDLLDTGDGLIKEINTNIVSIEELFENLETITSALSTILSPENQKGKTKSYYIDAFTKLEKDVTDYSKNFGKLMKKLENDNTTYDTFIASCNLNSAIDSASSNDPDAIRKIIEKNLVENDNTFVNIAESLKDDDTDTIDNGDGVDTTIADEATGDDVINDISDDELLSAESLLEDEDLLNEIDLESIDDIENTPADTSTLDNSTEVDDNIEDEPAVKDIVDTASTDDTIVDDSSATDVDADSTESTAPIESFIDKDIELPDIKITDNEKGEIIEEETADNTDVDTSTNTDTEIDIDADEIINTPNESISLSDDLQEIIDGVNSSSDTEDETKNVISEGFEGLMNASSSYTIDALKKSNKDFYDNLKNMSFEYDDFSTPISQIGGFPRNLVANNLSSNSYIPSVNAVDDAKTYDSTTDDSTSSNNNYNDVTNNNNTDDDDNSSDDSTTIHDEKADDNSVENDGSTSEMDEDALYDISDDELITNLDEVEILADALNNSDNVTITMQDRDSDEEAVVKGNTDTPNTLKTSLSKDKIEKIIKAEADNETLIISEKNNKIYLPYKMSELKNYMHSYPGSYTDPSDVVKQEFILELSEFMQHPSKTRFQETYTLIRNRDGKSVASAVLYGLKLVKKSNLSPAVIAACKHKEELDRYLSCLKENKLDEFKAFNIMYEINPHKQ